jgi:chondroitin-sulfate-ABC endolyase/exolyase
MLTVFAQGDPVSDIASGYRLNHGWDWYRMPGATAVHFPIAPRGPLEHRRFSPETFLGAVSCDGQNGAWGMLLNEDLFADGRPVGLKARKSAFFVDDLIVLLGSGISSVADEHPVETTLFQCHLTQGGKYRLEPANCLTDPAGNGYYVPDADNLSVFQGKQASYCHDGRTPTEGEYAVAWIDHGIAPHDASYACAILVRGGDSIRQLAENPKSRFRVLEQSDSLHHVDFPTHRMSGFVVFEPSETNHSIVSRLTQPCLVMCRETPEGVLRVAVTNPDLGLLPADAPQPDLRWIGRGDNQYLASQARPVQVTLRGSWRVIEPQTAQVRRSMKGGNTVLDFNCKDGRTIQVNVRRG